MLNKAKCTMGLATASSFAIRVLSTCWGSLRGWISNYLHSTCSSGQVERLCDQRSSADAAQSTVPCTEATALW